MRCTDVDVDSVDVVSAVTVVVCQQIGSSSLRYNSKSKAVLHSDITIPTVYLCVYFSCHLLIVVCVHVNV